MTDPSICPCGGDLDSDKLRCAACRGTTNQTQKQIYASRKAQRLCTWCGEAAMVMPDGTLSQFCRRHRIARNKYLRDRKTRLELEAEKKKAPVRVPTLTGAAHTMPDATRDPQK